MKYLHKTLRDFIKDYKWWYKKHSKYGYFRSIFDCWFNARVFNRELIEYRLEIKMTEQLILENLPEESLDHILSLPPEAKTYFTKLTKNSILKLIKNLTNLQT